MEDGTSPRDEEASLLVGHSYHDLLLIPLLPLLPLPPLLVRSLCSLLGAVGAVGVSSFYV